MLEHTRVDWDYPVMGSDPEYTPMGVASQRSGVQCHPGACPAWPRASACAFIAADLPCSQPSGQLGNQKKQVASQLGVAMQMTISLARPGRAEGPF
eukprot:4106571-Pyramimonas_sp.AAC.1